VCDPIQLADVALGQGGFIMDGLPSLYGGVAVSGAGDVNGDGLADLITGAPIFDLDLGGISNRTYVVFGKTDTDEVLPEDVEQGSGGYVLHGEISNHGAWESVSGAGDVNGDGLDDVIVGTTTTTTTTPPATYAGRTYVVFGKTDTNSVLLEDVTGGIGGFAMDGEWEDSESGSSVSGAGDVNGDGLPDVIVGTGYPTRAYVVFGKADTGALPLIDVAQGIGGFALDGEDPDDRAAYPVSDVGDMNGDGLADVLAGAPRADPNGLENAGRIYVVFGKASTENVSLSDVAQGIGGFAIDGEFTGGEYYAYLTAAGPGDVNDDGIPDVVVGAYRADANGLEGSGRAYVVFGKASTESVSLADVALGIGGFAMDGMAAQDHAGAPVSGAGDLNADGLADIVVGAYGADPNGLDSGRTYVVFGKADGEKVDLSDVAQGRGGFAIDGEAEEHRSWGKGTASDVNGDGIPDFVAAAVTSAYDDRRVYVVFGGDFSCAGGG
jgi:hypothetical protein